jgi:hypothetical protein
VESDTSNVEIVTNANEDFECSVEEINKIKKRLDFFKLPSNQNLLNNQINGASLPPRNSGGSS